MKLNLPKSYHLSRAAHDVLTGGKFDLLPLESFNIQRVTAFKNKMNYLLKELDEKCKKDDIQENGEGYYVSYIVQKEKAGNLKNWYLILNQIRGDLDYFSDRWCYGRYISIKRLYELFLSDWEYYNYKVDYRYNNKTQKWWHPVEVLGKNAGYLKISGDNNDFSKNSSFKSWREPLKREDCIIK